MDTHRLSPFSLLLRCLDEDETRSVTTYEELRFRLTQIFRWKGCFDADADVLTDVVFERVGSKLAAGELIDNATAYCVSVARFVWLEHTRKRRELGMEELPEILVQMNTDEADGPELRIRCLRRCLIEVTKDDLERRLIVGYYDNSNGDKNKEVRRTLAAELGLSASALKVKACRLRARLERCINECVQAVTKPPAHNTYHREVSEG